MKLILASLSLFLLASSDGRANAARTVASVAKLRSSDFREAQSLVLSGFYAGSTKGGGTLTAIASGGDDSCLVYEDKAGHRFKRNLNGQPLDVTMCGARCGGTQVTDGRATAGSPVITSTKARWTSTVVGWRAVVNKAGPSGHQIDTTVAAVDAAGSLKLAVAAGTTSSGDIVSVYPDDTAALDAALAAAGKAGIFVQLPPGAVCGYANPGASVLKKVAGPGILLNSGTLWLAQTGAAVDTGVGLQFSANGSALKGPGVISGLYQTDQNTPQFNMTAVLFGATSGNSISGNIVIQNTKGRAFLGDGVKDFLVSDVTTRACGDFVFHPPEGMDIMTGRSMCGQVTAPSGTLTVKNYTALDAAQSGFLLYGPTDSSFRGSFVGCRFSGNGYYGLDIEEVSGMVTVSDCTQTGSGQTPLLNLPFGGYVIRDVAYFSANNIKSTLTDANAFVIQSVDSKANLRDWSIDRLNLSGTPAKHAATLYIAFTYNGIPQHISLRNVTYDNWTVYANGAPCTRAAPRQQVLLFDNVRASGLYKGTQTEIDFQANPGQLTYVEGRNSDLGTANIKALAGNSRAIYLDTVGVRRNGPPFERALFPC